MQAIILLGPPGAGKGTVAEDLKRDTDYVHVSTGDILRDAVKGGRPVGLKAKTYMEQGELVPDEIILQIVREFLDRGDAGGRYMFDGFPRTSEQARMLDEIVGELGGSISSVFLLEVPQEVLIQRIAGRRICRQCGAVFNVSEMPPKVDGVCDNCEGALYQRPDDNEETVLNRLDVFKQQTESLIAHYEEKSLLVRVDAAKDRRRTEMQILAALEKPASNR